MVEQDCEPTSRAGLEARYPISEVVCAFELFDDNTFKAQIITPHFLDQFGIVNTFDPDATRSRHPGWCGSKVDRTRRGKARFGGHLMDCRLSEGYRLAIDHEGAGARGQRVVSTMPISDHYLLGFKRQDRADATRRTMFDNNTHLGGHRWVDRLAMSGRIEINLVGQRAIAHLGNCSFPNLSDEAPGDERAHQSLTESVDARTAQILAGR